MAEDPAVVAGNAVYKFLSSIKSSKALTDSQESSARRLGLVPRTSSNPKVPNFEFAIASKHQLPQLAWDQLFEKGRLVFPSLTEALTASGWMEIPGKGVKVDSDSYLSDESTARLALETTGKKDQKVDPSLLTLDSVSSHRLAFLNSSHSPVLSTASLDYFWREVEVLRAARHENIIAYFAHFAVQDHRLVAPEIYLLTEYATAGSLKTELMRYPGCSLSESSARYYGLQICAGVKHIHGLKIAGIGLKLKHILLKFNADGSKTCLLSAFDLCETVSPGEEHPYGRDVVTVAKLCVKMMGLSGSASLLLGADDDNEPDEEAAVALSENTKSLVDAVKHLESDDSSDSDDGEEGDDPPASTFPQSIDALTQSFPWFAGPVTVPHPGNRVSKDDPRFILKSVTNALKPK